jgi:hypothetical protein
MMVAVVAFGEQFEPGHFVAEVKPFDHPHAFEQVKGTIDGGQVAVLAREGSKDLLCGYGVGLGVKQFQNRLARAGDAPGMAPETLSQFRKLRSMGMSATSFHYGVSMYHHAEETQTCADDDRRELGQVEPVDIAAFEENRGGDMHENADDERGQFARVTG